MAKGFTVKAKSPVAKKAPEWVVNEFDWYEDTELVWHVDNSGIHIQQIS